MITFKEYHTIERYNFLKVLDRYYYDFNIYEVVCYKLFGIIPLFKRKVLLNSGRDNCYGRPKRKERY